MKSFEPAEAIAANKPAKWEVPLRDGDHVFLKGHRMMVQVQATWFPVTDRNPQQFVKSINDARNNDFLSASQRVSSTPTMPSRFEIQSFLDIEFNGSRVWESSKNEVGLGKWLAILCLATPPDLKAVQRRSFTRRDKRLRVHTPGLCSTCSLSKVGTSLPL